tara:strand:- start:72 stop:269 length:198 start_codon:yes stop_codon:yes gene_type:complete
MQDTINYHLDKTQKPVQDQRSDRATDIGKCMAKLTILKTMLKYDNIAVLKNYIDEIYNQLDKIEL